MTFYTYIHCQADDGKVFYVGKGHGKRAWNEKYRNRYWNAIVAKHGLKVEIAARWDTEEEAFEHERFLISCMRSLGLARANICDGGQGSKGFKHSEEWKQKLREIMRGRPPPVMTEESRRKISESLRGRVGCTKGMKLSQDHIERRTKTRLERVKRYEEGGLSLSIREWEAHLGVHYSTVQYRLKKGLPLLEVTPRGKRTQRDT